MRRRKAISSFREESKARSSVPVTFLSTACVPHTELVCSLPISLRPHTEQPSTSGYGLLLLARNPERWDLCLLRTPGLLVVMVVVGIKTHFSRLACKYKNVGKVTGGNYTLGEIIYNPHLINTAPSPVWRHVTLKLTVSLLHLHRDVSYTCTDQATRFNPHFPKKFLHLPPQP